MHGKGTYYYRNGRKYEGNWVAGYKEGYGVFRWPNGDSYEGEFHRDKCNGPSLPPHSLVIFFYIIPSFLFSPVTGPTPLSSPYPCSVFLSPFPFAPFYLPSPLFPYPLFVASSLSFFPWIILLSLLSFPSFEYKFVFTLVCLSDPISQELEPKSLRMVVSTRVNGATTKSMVLVS